MVKLNRSKMEARQIDMGQSCYSCTGSQFQSDVVGSQRLQISSFESRMERGLRIGMWHRNGCVVRRVGYFK
jgi:hypothetical protein